MEIPGAEGYLTRGRGVPLTVTWFEVFEVPKFLPTGEGQHNWALVEKINRNTISVAKEIARYGRISYRDVGYAGLKDKNARTVQWFSSPGPIPPAGRGFRALLVRRSSKKLKRGNLLGNWFSIEADVTPPFVESFPNFFGPQRFSTNNHIIGRLLISGERERALRMMREQSIPLERRYFQLMEDAYVSYLFNRVLSLRLEHPEPVEGDIMSRHGPTGPIFGKKMSFAGGRQGELERKVLEEEGLELSDFPGTGTRRPLFIKPLWSRGFRFFLPRGSYATALLREIVKEKELRWSITFSSSGGGA